MGNEKLTTGLSQGWSGYECIGSIADEKNDVANCRNGQQLYFINTRAILRTSPHTNSEAASKEHVKKS